VWAPNGARRLQRPSVAIAKPIVRVHHSCVETWSTRRVAVWAFALCLALFAVTFRGLIPTGYMVQASAEGPALVMCQPAGDRDGSDDAPREAPCAFTGVQTLYPAPAPTDLATPVVWTPERRPLEKTDRGVRPEPTGPPPPARAPPSLI
jgi:hypothetical protein